MNPARVFNRKLTFDREKEKSIMSNMANTIPVTKIEYQRLRKIAKRYELLRQVFVEDLFEEPPIKDVERIIKDFRETGLYNEPFLKSLARGLKESFSQEKN